MMMMMLLLLHITEKSRVLGNLSSLLYVNNKYQNKTLFKAVSYIFPPGKRGADTLASNIGLKF